MSREVATVRVDEPEAPRGPSAGGAGGAGAGGAGGAGAGAGGAGAGGARGPEGGATPERQARGRRWPLAVLLSVLVLLLGVVGYGATLAPTHVSQLRERASDGKTAEALGWGAQVVVPDGWAVRPLVREVISWPPLPPLLDWSVVFGADTGLALSTPDRVLDVDVVGLSSADTDAALFAARAEEILGADRDRGAALPLRTEQLASGATLTHLDGDREILAIVDTGHVRVSALAHLADGAGGGDARAGDAGAEAPTLDEYRPVLGQLLEQITAQ